MNKGIYIGLVTLGLATVGGLVTSNEVEAKTKTKTAVVGTKYYQTMPKKMRGTWYLYRSSKSLNSEKTGGYYKVVIGKNYVRQTLHKTLLNAKGHEIKRSKAASYKLMLEPAAAWKSEEKPSAFLKKHHQTASAHKIKSGNWYFISPDDPLSALSTGKTSVMYEPTTTDGLAQFSMYRAATVKVGAKKQNVLVAEKLGQDDRGYFFLKHKTAHVYSSKKSSYHLLYQSGGK